MPYFPENSNLNTVRTLCECCTHMREVLTPKGGRFLRCVLAETLSEFAKYPSQPVLGCGGFALKS